MKVFLHTFGCKANQYDTETVRQALEHSGAQVVDDPGIADAAVINSCTVTHVGERKLRGYVRQLARANRDVRTVVIGCAAALDDGTLNELPNVVDVVGGAAPRMVLESLGVAPNEIDPVLRRFQSGQRAWLKVQDGCDEHCTFCATTIARGINRSRSMSDICDEATALAASAQEIVLTGVHIGSYGRDLDGTDLGRLVEHLIDRVPSVRFRLSSVEATEVDERLEALMIDAPSRLAPHVHAPLQSGSDRILKRMGRHWYTATAYRRRIERLAERLPSFGLGADVMVGFPGEEARDHADTLSIVESLPFTYLHVFSYSQRPHAAARHLGAPAAPPVAAERSAELRALAAAKGAAYRAQRAGTEADVVTLQRSRGQWEGVTEDYLDVCASTSAAVPARFRGRVTIHSDGSLGVKPHD